jgi:hypothetical protein
MRILLLLSAFLAALSGGVAHARVAGPVAEVSASASVRAERVAPVVVADARVFQDRVNFASPRANSAPARSGPLYADRLLI